MAQSPKILSADEARAATVTMAVPDVIAKAARLLTAGRIPEAQSLIEQLLELRPRLAEAHSLLGVIRQRQGRIDDAIASMRTAIRHHGKAATHHSNLGELLRQKGDRPAAEAALMRAVALDPALSHAQNNLGIVLYEQGKYEEAAASYRRALVLDPRYPEAHNNLGNALRASGKPDEAIACYEAALALRPNYAEAYGNMGTTLRDLDRFEEAETAYRQAIALRPGFADAMASLAALLHARNRNDEALRLLGDVLRDQPKHVPSLILAGRIQLARGQLDLAESACRMALKEEPENAEALSVMGQVCHEADRFDEAITHLEASLRLKPEFSESLNFLGIALKSIGRFKEARTILQRAMLLHPQSVGPYANLADLESFRDGHPLVAAMEALLETVARPEDDRYTSLHFALGKAYDDMGNWQKAFHHFSTGARMKRRMLAYDEKEAFGFFDAIRTVFSVSFFANRPFAGLQTEKPVFIIGMPRSGSTLVEQVLSAHPEVHGAGEIKTLSQTIGRLRQKMPALPRFPEIAERMMPGQFEAIAAAYVAHIDALAPSASRVTDKLLSNYYFAGLIHTLLPKARIIHTRRNALDTCWSAYTKLFKDDMPHSYELGELGRYYRKYEQLMAHWRMVLPSGILLDVDYEDMVDDLEGAARRIVDFCGLEWSEQCLAFHLNDRPVRTASVSQVRQPIYRSSLEKWRNYRTELGPLMAALELDCSERKDA